MKKIINLSALMLLILMCGYNQADEQKKVLIVLTSHSDLGNTGKKTGFWLPELTHPYYEFVNAGIKVDVASIDGGVAPIDSNAFEEHDDYHEIFLNDAVLMSKVIRSIALADINASEYQAVLFSGGSGPMWDFPNNPDINRISSAIYESKGIVSAICHGNAALINITLSDGSLLIKDRRIAAFTNEEEASLGTTDIIPFLLQDKLVEQGAIHVNGEAWKENVVVSDRLITGQNPASAKKLAQAIINKLNGV
ncbi:type 1 glutamine amidotransferase domain-containing protein [Microbulbifer echini]|uniref:Type 1 glutamine amidotransferase domain-containing protein n=1 Tax=Microbulbifer echini TaxID=1529067 RepID=A0ABV4NPS8_9GAMM